MAKVVREWCSCRSSSGICTRKQSCESSEYVVYISRNFTAITASVGTSPPFCLQTKTLTSTKISPSRNAHWILWFVTRTANCDMFSMNFLFIAGLNCFNTVCTPTISEIPSKWSLFILPLKYLIPVLKYINLNSVGCYLDFWVKIVFANLTMWRKTTLIHVRCFAWQSRRFYWEGCSCRYNPDTVIVLIRAYHLIVYQI